MKRLFALLLLFACLMESQASTAIPDMKFRRLDTRDGLSNSQINCLFQDSKGYIWIGTSYGLNRYDGYRFRTFYSNPNDTMTLRNNYVDMVWEDKDGLLWLKQGMNYAILDPATERVNRSPSTVLSKLGIKGGVDRIFIDSHKNLWVKTYDEGLYCYNPTTKKLSLTKYGYDEWEIPKEFYVSSFADYGGQLLVASSDGDLMAVDGKDGRVVWMSHHMKENGGLPSNEYALHLDKDGDVFVQSSGRIFVFEQSTQKWYNSIYSYFSEKGYGDLPENLLVWDIVVDHRGWLWLATDHEGVFVVDTKTKEVRQFLNNKFDETSLIENTIKHLLVDKNGGMWLGSYRSGLSQYIEKLSGFMTLELGDINATTEDIHGNYWLGTDNRGIIKYDPKTGDTQFYNRANSGFASDIMVAGTGAKDGSVWFGTYNGGLIRVAPNGQVTNYTARNAEDALLNNNVWSVIEDKWGDIWIGTLGNGVQRLNLKTGKFKTWSSYNTPLKENFMTTLSWIKKGWLMVGHSQFYSLINPVSGEVKNIEIPAIPGQQAAMPATTCVMEDSRGLIWHGSTAGCCIVNSKTGHQTMLDMNSGLLGSSVVGIAEDHLHSMWIVTEHGVSNVNPNKEENGEWSFVVRSFSSKDGLQQGPYNQRSISCTHDGIILIGGVGGVDVINPKLVTAVKNSERPVFSGLKLFGQQVEVGKEYEGRVILEEALDVCRELTLRYDESEFSIQLASDKGEIHNPSRFIYMLEGFSDKWIKTEDANPNISYMSLHHGNYVLHVRMLNDDGTMGDIEETLEITITPPLLRNRWLMVFFILCVAAAIFFWRRRYIKKQAERLELMKLRMEEDKKRWMAEIRKQEREAARSELGILREDSVEAPEETVIHKERTDLVSLFRQVCDQFKAPEDKPIRLSFFPFVDELILTVERHQMQSLLQILLQNAAKFSPTNGKVKVFVEKEQDKAVLRVADSGIGISEEAMPTLFDEVDDDNNLGLNKVFDIVQAHNGSITPQPNHGGGTVFKVELPLEKEEIIEEAVMMDEE